MDASIYLPWAYSKKKNEEKQVKKDSDIESNCKQTKTPALQKRTKKAHQATPNVKLVGAG